MSQWNRTDVEDLRGVSRMAFDAVGGLAGVVERMHTTIQQRPGVFGAPRHQPARGITGFVYRTVRGSTRWIGTGVDAVLGAATDLLPGGDRSDGREALVAVANGVYGDYLARTANPLAIDMSLRVSGRAVDVFDPGRSLAITGSERRHTRVLVLVHGLCMNDLRWRRNGHDHGMALAEELGWSPLYLRYNSGLHVGDNGRRFSELLDRLFEHWPVPVEELCIVGHSMGGLVARSACHHAGQGGSRWLDALRKLVFLGTPHFGSPLERGGRWVDYLLDVSPYSAPLARAGKQRSAGIRDLRHGSVTTDGARIALPRGAACYAAAATLATRRSVLADRLVGDGLVPLNSALGRHHDRSLALGIPKSNQWIGYEMGHLDLLCRPEVYAQLKDWLAA